MLFRLMKKMTQSGGNYQNIKESLGTSTGDRQFSFSGFIELIGVITYMVAEVCSLVPVLHFVYASML